MGQAGTHAILQPSTAGALKGSGGKEAGERSAARGRSAGVQAASHLHLRLRRVELLHAAARVQHAARQARVNGHDALAAAEADLDSGVDALLGSRVGVGRRVGVVGGRGRRVGDVS